MIEPVLDECPDCGSSNLTPADEVDNSMWEDTDTACQDCELVYDPRGRVNGGFNSEVAKELHSTIVDSLI